MTFQLPVPYLPGSDEFEDGVQQNFDALAQTVGTQSKDIAGNTLTLTLKNGWQTQSGHDPLAVRRVGPLVVLYGTINGTSATSVVAATLTGLYAPVSIVRAGTVYYTGTTYAVGPVIVKTSGDIEVYGNSGALTNRDFFAVQAHWLV